MDAHTVIEEWDESSFDGGFDELRALESQHFSGAVEADATWLFFRDGEPLAVVADLETDPQIADVDAFENAVGRIHEAPHPAAGSLAAMLALDGDVRGQYFSDDVPLSEVHQTLSEGGFTGYVELSENVLSGDYYAVYEYGDVNHLGFLGANHRMISDEEAQSKAEGEVGIYSVVAVRFPDVEIPSAAPQSSSPSEEPRSSSPSEEASDTSVADAVSGVSPATGDADEPIPDADGPISEADEPIPDADDPAEESTPEPTASESPSDTGSVASPPAEPDSAAQSDSSPNAAATDGTSDVPPSDASDTSLDGVSEAPPERSSNAEVEATDRATIEDVTVRKIPSLAPERSGRANEVASGSQSKAGAISREETATSSTEPGRIESSSESTPRPEPEPKPESEPKSKPQSGSEERTGPSRDEYERRIERLREELERLRDERDQLQQRISTLESAEPTERGANAPALSPADALAETKLLIREGTRGAATLEDAHSGDIDRETLEENLRIEYHTSFDEAETTVDGEPFEAWLRSSLHCEFAEWLVTDLLFEIRSTDSRSSMRYLYDALPAVDSVVFDDSVTVRHGEESQQFDFDVVFRNRMDEPLVVANVEEDNDPPGTESVTELVADASDVCGANETLAAAFTVTSSPFEAGAFDAVQEATSGSLLGRERYHSYVKLARTNGFHLCLVETGDDSFYLRVPEL